ncbi:MAG: SGNH/GDSL hydrolase family protein [Clostridia bacterium]|nr:SGNH/GDSL hydrolase family protein [Clostridia bacterium]
MKLSYEQLKSITCGATHHEACDNGVRFWRMTEAQIKHYRERGDEHQASWAERSAGVRLAFLTDSRTLTFSVDLLPDLTGRHLGFDVYENGVMIAHFGEEGKPVKNCFTKLDAGEKLVEIYFPWDKSVILNELCLDDGATIVPHKRSRTLLAFGDSITHGAHAVYPSLSYIHRLARMLDADLENRGVAGDKFSSVIAAEEPFESPDIVTVAYGTNDWSHMSLERFERECPTMLDILAKRYATAQIFVISPIWRADWDRETAIGIPLRAIYGKLCEYTAAYSNVTVIDAWNFVPHLPAFFGDGSLHPNDLGFGLYAECLYAEIRKHLK